jgi:tryptophanyl-tRNA synthetase
VKSLKDASKKMSKSDPGGCLYLCDEPDTVRAKVRRASTDSIKGITYDPAARPNLANVVELFAALRRIEPHALASEYATKNHEQFKNDLIAFFIHEFAAYRMGLLSIEQEEVERILEDASERAQNLAANGYGKVLRALKFRSA